MVSEQEEHQCLPALESSWVIGLVLGEAGRGIRAQGKKKSWALSATGLLWREEAWVLDCGTQQPMFSINLRLQSSRRTSGK